MTGDAQIEIERKFLVADLPPLGGLRATAIRQGYLTGPEDSAEIRLRRKGDACYMTLKSDGGLVRREYEIAITPEQFDALWPATEGRRIEKTRHTGRLPSGAEFELDLFAGDLAPLCLVEVEFASVEAATGFAAPEWFGAEVTENRSFRNKALASSGLPPSIAGS